MLKIPVWISTIFICAVILSLSAVWPREGVQQIEGDLAGAVPNNGEPPPVPPSGEVAPGGGIEASPDDITQPLSEGFEAGTLGQFVSVVATCAPGGCGWRLDRIVHTGAYAAMAPGVSNISDQQLTLSNPVAIPSKATAAQLTFWHRLSLDFTQDGGVLEVSTDGGESWVDAGINIISGGYNNFISSCCGNPLAGRRAWTGGTSYPEFSEVKVNLLPYAGHNLLFRFRLGTDNSVSGFGWWIDDITITIAQPVACPTPEWRQMAPYPIPIMDQATAVLGGQLYSFSGISNNLKVTNSYRYNPTDNNWTAIAPLPAARENPSAVSDGRYIYILGGWDSNGNSTNTLYRYDPLDDSYTTLAPYTNITAAQAAAYYNGEIYRIGGCSASICNIPTNTIEVYSISSNTWGMAANLPVREAFMMVSVYGDYIYAAGGRAALSYSLKTYRYDPNLDTWDDAAVADLPATRWGAASDFLNGKWVISGGSVGINVSSTVIAWDPVTNAWLDLVDMLQPRARMNGGAIGPAFYQVGGREPGNSFLGNVDNQRYLEVPCEPCQATNWVAAQPYPQGIAHYAFGQVGDDFYIFGGVTGGVVTNIARRYNAVSHTWVDLAPLPLTGEALSAAYLDGKFYVTQGSGGSAFQIYDIAYDTWSSAAPLPIDNSYGSALGAYYDQVFLVGGNNTSNAATYIYSVSDNHWSSGTSAPAPYYQGGYTQVGQYLYLVGSFGSTPVDENTGLPASSLLRVNPSNGNAPEANSTMTMRLNLGNGTWSTGPAWTPGRADFALASDGLKLYAIGGDAQGGGFFDPTSAVDEYRLSSWPGGAWVPSAPDLPSPRQGNQAGFYNIGCAGREIWSTGGYVPGLPGTYLSDHLYRTMYIQCNTNLCPGPVTINGSLAPGDLVANQSLYHDNTPGTCAVTDSCSVGASASYNFDRYPLVNNTGVQQCLTINANTACMGNNMIFVASYNGSFDYNNVCTNWIADMGSSPSPSGSYSHIVGPGQSIVVVVEEVNQGAGCSDYDLVISADNCLGKPMFYLPIVFRH